MIYLQSPDGRVYAYDPATQADLVNVGRAAGWVDVSDTFPVSQADALRPAQISAACRARILAVADFTAQQNIAQAGTLYAALRVDGAPEDTARAAVGFLPGDLTLAGDWQRWVAAMRAACQTAIATGADPEWPPVPNGVAEFAARF